MSSLTSSCLRLRSQARRLVHQQKASIQGSHFLKADEKFGRYRYHHHHSFGTASLPFQQQPRVRMVLSKDEKDQQERRNYHSTPKNEMVLYGTIIIVTTLGYVAYRKYNGLPLKPESVSESQSAYQKMEKDLQRRNEKYANKQ